MRCPLPMLTACALVLVCSTHASLSTESQRIIVTLKMAPSTSGAPMDVAATQDAFLKSLGTSPSVVVVRRYRNFPQLVFEADSDAVARIEGHPLVESVRRDLPSAPAR